METWTILVFLATAMVVLEVLQVYRRGAADHVGHLLLLAADLLLLGWAVRGGLWTSWQATVGVIGAGALVLVPSGIDALIRRAIQRDGLRLAARLAAVKELLTPGRAATAQRELFVEMAEVRAGRVEAVVRQLRARLVDAEGSDATAIHERIITALVFGGRHRDALTSYEAHLGRQHPARHPTLALHALRAYGEERDLERAGQLVHRLEQAAAGRDLAAHAVLPQARLLLVAYAGQAKLLGELLAEPALRDLPPRMRQLLEDAARRHAPSPTAPAPARTSEPPASPDVVPAAPAAPVAPAADSDAAATPHAAGDAATGAALDDAAVPTSRPAVVESAADEVAEYARTLGDRLRAELRRPERTTPPARRYLATLALIAVNALVYLLLTRLDRFQDGYDLVRAGASFHAAVRAGEWWRLMTALFLHDGTSPLHVTLNMLTLYVFGRYVEPIFGWTRFVVVYLVAGLAGNLTSLLLPGRGSPAVISIGASGAVFGLVGALMVTLVLRRGNWPEPFRRTLLVNLVVLTLLQLQFGASVAVVDNWAHIGGGFGGAVAALLLVPGGLVGSGRASRVVLAAVAACLAVVLGVSAVAVARTRVATTLGRLPTKQQQVGPVKVTATAYASHVLAREPDWPGQEILADAIAELELTPHLAPVAEQGLAGALLAAVERDRAAVDKLAGNEARRITLEAATAPPVAGWEGRAQLETAPERRLLLYYARLVPGTTNEALVVEINMRDAPRHRALRESTVASMLGSIDAAAITRAPTTPTPVAQP